MTRKPFATYESKILDQQAEQVEEIDTTLKELVEDILSKFINVPSRDY
jgi:peptide deformylase